MDIFRENYIGKFLCDVVTSLNGETFDQIVWVGMHGWIQYVAKAIWKAGWKMDTVITNSDSRWGQEAYSDGIGHKVGFKPFETARETGNGAVYIIANKHTDSMINQLTSFGIEASRIFAFETGQEYLDKANRNIKEKYLNGLNQLSHRETQEALFELMKVFKNFCEENNLRYYMTGGTLLGAVRHQGFVPWDNDVDFQMPVRDFLRFEEIYSGSRYQWMSHRKDPLLLASSAKLADTKIYRHLYADPRITPLGIDIIPIGCFPGERVKIDREKKRWEDFWEKVNEEYFSKGHFEWDYTAELYDRLNAWAQSDGDIIGETYDNRLEAAKELYAESVEFVFEGERFAAPKGWDYILRQVYGNYMKMPPVEKRVGFKLRDYRKND